MHTIWEYLNIVLKYSISKDPRKVHVLASLLSEDVQRRAFLGFARNLVDDMFQSFIFASASLFVVGEEVGAPAALAANTGNRIA